MSDTAYDGHMIARVARVRDEELAGQESSAAARALLTAIVAGTRQPTGHPVPLARTATVGGWRWSTRRLVLVAAAAAVVTAAAVVGPGLLGDRPGGATSYANAAIEVRLDGRFYVARIKDPLADRERYTEAFRAVGKNVAIDLVPVAPRYVGQILSSGATGSGRAEGRSEFEPTGPERVDCFHQPERCTLTISISVDTTGTVTYTIGRAARPGEALYDPAHPADVAPDSPTVTGSGRAGGGN